MRNLSRLIAVCVAVALVAGAASTVVAQNQSFGIKDKSRLTGSGVLPTSPLTAGNDIYRIYVDDPAQGDCGLWTATTGPLHPAGPALNVLYGDGEPGTSDTILRSYATDTYYSTSLSWDTLCQFGQPAVSVTDTSITTTWNFTDGANQLTLVQEIAVETVGGAGGGFAGGGETVENTFIRETHTVTNATGPEFSFGLRKHWDWEIANNDGPWIGTCDEPTQACDRSMNFQADGGGAGVPPAVYTINDSPAASLCPDGVTPDQPVGCGGTPTYLIAGTSGPPSSLIPPPDAPELMQFNSWSLLVNDPWEPVLLDDASCFEGDTALAYFYGRTEGSALVLQDGESRSFTQYVVAGGDIGCPDSIEPPMLTLDKTADPMTYDTNSQTISYFYDVTNTGASAIPGPMTVDDDKIASVVCPPMTSVGNMDMALDPDETLTCTATYVIDQADLIAGSVTNVATASADGNQSNEDSVTITENAPSSISVDKSASPDSVPASGGDVTYTVTVVNTSVADSVDIEEIEDNQFVIDIASACVPNSSFAGPGFALPYSLGIGEGFVCTFTRNVSGVAGETFTNIVTVSGTDSDGEAVDNMDDADVLFTEDHSPASISVTKTANVESVSATGGDVVYTVTIVNNSAADAVEIQTIVDDKFTINPPSECVFFGADFTGSGISLPRNLEIGDSIVCTFTREVSGVAGETHTNVVTVTGTDEAGEAVENMDDADVLLEGVVGRISVDVDKTADPQSVPPGGGDVTYTIVVTNTSDTSFVDVISLVDDTFLFDFGADCVFPPTPDNSGVAILQPEESFSCSFTRLVLGAPGTVHTNVATATGFGLEGQLVNDSDSAEVLIEDDPLLVILESFTADVDARGRVVLRWKTLAEIDTVGFRLFRALEGQEAQRISRVIQSEGGELFGAEYAFRDRAPKGAGTVTYYLQEVDTEGFSSVVGTVSVEIGASIGGVGR